jgi:signal peptidase I
MAQILGVSASLKAIALGASAISAMVVQPYRPIIVTGNSMQPTYKSGQLLVADRRTTEINRGDVVIFKRGREKYIKRVAYVPGDYYIKRQYKDGTSDMVLVDLRPNMTGMKLVAAQVPTDHVYVIGDNLFESEDSRSFGPIPVGSITAVVRNAPISPRVSRTSPPLTSKRAFEIASTSRAEWRAPK